MADKNEKYVFESEDDGPVNERVIIRTFDAPQTEKFTIQMLEEEIAGLENQKDSLDLDIAKIQEKIDEATAALITKK